MVHNEPAVSPDGNEQECVQAPSKRVNGRNVSGPLAAGMDRFREGYTRCRPNGGLDGRSVGLNMVDCSFGDEPFEGHVESRRNGA